MYGYKIRVFCMSKNISKIVILYIIDIYNVNCTMYMQSKNN